MARREQDRLAPSAEPATRRLTRAAAAKQKRDSDSEGHTTVSWPDEKAGVVDKPSVAIKAGLQQGLPPPPARASGGSPGPAHLELSGLWGLLPDDILESILRQCTPQQLGMLETTCTYFRRSPLIERIARQRLKAIPRARGLKPAKRDSDRWLILLHFVTCQSNAAAQATAVAFGAYHTAALLIRNEVAESASNEVQHQLLTFGRGFHGQLGSGRFDNELQPHPVSLGFKPCQDNADLEEETMPAVVACGSNHTASISRRGELYTWGLASSGELGHSGWTPVEVPLPQPCLAPGVRIVSVTAGAHHTLAIAENGGLWACGKGRQGQLGTGDMQDATRLSQVGGLKSFRIVSAAAGTAHSLALASDGSLFSWGDGRYGQLGHPQLQQLAAVLPNQAVVIPTPQKIARLDPSLLQAPDRVTAIAAAGCHSAALTVGGNVLMFGRNEHGELGTGDLENRWRPTRVELSVSKEEDAARIIRAVQVICGKMHTVVLISNNGALEVRTTGNNAWGQLGLGDRKERNKFTPVPRLSGVAAVQAGDCHSGAVTSASELFLWGRGDCGQLGGSDERNRFKPTLLSGFRVVHPDRTLRRSKRSMPHIRPSQNPAKKARLNSYNPQ